MVRKAAMDIAAWERFYEKRERPWGGTVELPPLPQGARALELGCGGGRLLVPLARRLSKAGGGAELVGMDLSRNALSALRGDCPGRLVRGDAQRPPFREASFDLVLCRHVLGHIPEDGRNRAAHECLLLLKKGGRLLFEGFSTGDARFGKGQLTEEGTFLRGDGLLHHHFTSEEVLRLFWEASSVEPRSHGWTERAGRELMRRESITAVIVR